MAPKIDSNVPGFDSSHRDELLQDSQSWLSWKRKNDGAEGLWRVNDKLYDLNQFKDKHPGGEMWFDLSEGTDITEAFITHHINEKQVENILEKYYVRDAKTKRKGFYTFKDDGFYKTLKRKVAEKLKEVPKNSDIESKFIADSLLISTYIVSILALYFKSYTLVVLAGYLLTSTTIISHNFFHQKDTFRMYYFDISFLSAIDWRITHVLSHHLFTNTMVDLELSAFEPFFDYRPHGKSFWKKYAPWIYSPIIYTLYFFHGFFTRIYTIIFKKNYLSAWTLIIPFIHLFVMYFVTGESFLMTLKFWVLIMMYASFHFVLVGQNAGHHHPKIFHEGDVPSEDKDWGLRQMDALMDRHEVIGNPFLAQTNFGDHALHHLFPTIDHSKLRHLYPVFNETCKQFNIEFRTLSTINLIIGQFLQLARTAVTTRQERYLKKRE